MSISLVRIDDRMIHGQVVLMWTKYYQGDAIVVLGDDIVMNDPFIKRIVMQAGFAAGKKVYLFSVDDAVKKLPKVIASNKQYYFISKKIHELAEVRRRGIDFGNQVIFGTASKGDDTVEVYNNIYLSQEDIHDCEYLSSQGIDLIFKLTPDEKGTTWKNVRKSLL